MYCSKKSWCCFKTIHTVNLIQVLRVGVERGSQQSQTQIQIVNEDVEEIMLQYGTASRCVATKVTWKEPYILILINFLFDPGFPSYKKNPCTWTIFTYRTYENELDYFRRIYRRLNCSLFSRLYFGN